MTNIHKLARRITEKYFQESPERGDAAQRAALARRLLDKIGGMDKELLDKFYTDPNMALAAEFLEGKDHTFGALMALIDRRNKEQ